MGQAPTVTPSGGNARASLVNPMPGPIQSFNTDAMAKGLVDWAKVNQNGNEARDSIVAVDSLEKFKQRSIQEMAKLNPLAENYQEQVSSLYKQLKDETIENTNFDTRAVQERFGTQLEQQSAGGVTLALAHRQDALNTEAKRVRGEVEDNVYASIRKDPDGYNAYLGEYAQKAQYLNKSIKQEELPALQAKFGDAAITARAEGYAMQGRYDAAKTALDANQGQLHPETYRNGKRMIHEIETKNRQDFLAKTASQVADTEIAIVDAQNTADLTRLRTKVETMNGQGFFAGREEKRASLIRSIETKRDQLIGQGQLLAGALLKLDSGTGVDNQAEADAAWEHISEGYKASDPKGGAPSDVWTQRAAQYAANSGFVPGQYKRIMYNAERTENPELVGVAAQVYDVFKAKAPDADLSLPDQGSRVKMASTVVNLLGLGYKEAGQFVIDRTPDAATLKHRETDFDKAAFKDFDPRKQLVKVGGAENPWFSKADDVPEPVARDYERLLRLHYGFVGDKDLATAAATRDFQDRYGQTKVGGQPRVVRTPPERAFPGATNSFLSPEQKTKIIDSDITSSLKAMKIEPGIVVSNDAVGQETEGARDTSGIAPYILKPDAQTEKDVANGKPPSYEVGVRNSFGIHVPVPVSQKPGVTSHLAEMDAAMKLTPEEKYLYQHHMANLSNGGGVQNSDGSHSTLLQMSTEAGGKTYNIPTVWNNKVLSPDEAFARAKKVGLDKFPSYKNEAEAEARYQRMHDFMEQDTFSAGGPTMNLRYVMPTLDQLQRSPEYQRIAKEELQRADERKKVGNWFLPAKDMEQFRARFPYKIDAPLKSQGQ